MSVQQATDYFRTLSSHLLNTHITDQEGAELSLEVGFQQAVERILKAASLGKILVIGNGGSAAIASHVHNDLCNNVKARALVLSEVPLLTALTNDYSYSVAYEKQIELWATADDLLLAISSSGKSENILRAARAAIAQQCDVITFSGFTPENPLRRMGMLNFFVPTVHYGHVESCHACQLHYLTDTAAMQRKTVVDSRKSVSL